MYRNVVLCDCEEFRKIPPINSEAVRVERRVLGYAIFRRESIVSFMAIECPPEEGVAGLPIPGTGKIYLSHLFTNIIQLLWIGGGTSPGMMSTPTQIPMGLGQPPSVIIPVFFVGWIDFRNLVLKYEKFYWVVIRCKLFNF